MIVLPLLRPWPAETDDYSSLKSGEAPLFLELGDQLDDTLEDEIAEDFEKVAKKVSSIVEAEKFFDEEPATASVLALDSPLVVDSPLALASVVNFSELIE